MYGLTWLPNIESLPCSAPHTQGLVHGDLGSLHMRRQTPAWVHVALARGLVLPYAAKTRPHPTAPRRSELRGRFSCIMSASTTSAVRDYFSHLYERASNMVTSMTKPREGETRPLLHGQSSNAEYGTTSDNNIPVPKPRKVVTPIKVEAKVWFANEVCILGMAYLYSEPGFRGSVRRCCSARSPSLCSTLPRTTTPFPARMYLQVTLLRPKRSAPLVSSMPRFPCLSCNGAYTTTSAESLSLKCGGREALVRVRRRSPVDDLIGPPLVCGLTFIAILANFIIACMYMLYSRHSAPAHVRQTDILLYPRVSVADIRLYSSDLCSRTFLHVACRCFPPTRDSTWSYYR